MSGDVRREVIKKYSGLMEGFVNVMKREVAGWSDGLSELEKETSIIESIYYSGYFDDATVEESSVITNCVLTRILERYGILSDLLDDPNVNEIMINGPDHIFVEKNREIIRVDDAFLSETELEETIRMLASDVHREINEAHPIVDARLPSGYRVSGVLKTVALNGPILTIRKFSNETITMEDLVGFGSITEDCSNQLRDLVRCGYNIFISGDNVIIGLSPSDFRKEGSHNGLVHFSLISQ